MNINKVNKIKNVLKSPISEYKNIVCDFNVKSSDFFENAENSYNEIEQLIFRVALKKIRNLKNITQKNLAELTGKKAITIQGYENDRLKISIEFIYLVIKKINLTKEEFIENILFSNELFSILYTFVKTLVHGAKRENEDEIFNFIEKIFSNIIIELFENEECNKKHNFEKKLSNDITLIEYLEEYLKQNGYTIKSSATEIILKKDDCYIEISSDEFSKICDELNNYFLFLISKYKTQK